MTYTVPSNLVAVGNGKLRSVKNIGEKTSYEWFVGNPINNYNISVQIGNYVAVQDTFIKDNQTHFMNHYVLDYNKELASNFFPQSKEVIRFTKNILAIINGMKMVINLLKFHILGWNTSRQ